MRNENPATTKRDATNVVQTKIHSIAQHKKRNYEMQSADQSADDLKYRIFEHISEEYLLEFIYSGVYSSAKILYRFCCLVILINGI